MTEDELLEETRLIARGERLAEIFLDDDFEAVLEGLRMRAFQAFANPKAPAEDVGAARAIAMAIQGVREEMQLHIDAGELAALQRKDRLVREQQEAELAARRNSPNRRSSDHG